TRIFPRVSNRVGKGAQSSAPISKLRQAPLSTLHPLELYRDRRAAPECLIDHAIALGELEQLIKLVLRRLALDVEAKSNGREADRHRLVDPERAAKIDIALRRHLGGLEPDTKRSRDRIERHAGTGDQRFEQHV